MDINLQRNTHFMDIIFCKITHFMDIILQLNGIFFLIPQLQPDTQPNPVGGVPQGTSVPHTVGEEILPINGIFPSGYSIAFEPPTPNPSPDAQNLLILYW